MGFSLPITTLVYLSAVGGVSADFAVWAAVGVTAIPSPTLNAAFFVPIDNATLLCDYANTSKDVRRVTYVATGPDNNYGGLPNYVNMTGGAICNGCQADLIFSHRHWDGATEYERQFFEPSYGEIVIAANETENAPDPNLPFVPTRYAIGYQTVENGQPTQQRLEGDCRPAVGEFDCLFRGPGLSSYKGKKLLQCTTPIKVVPS